MMSNQSSELDQKPAAARAPQGLAGGAPARSKLRGDEAQSQRRLLPQLSSRFGKSPKKPASSLQLLARSDSSTTAGVAQRIDTAAVGQQQQPPLGIPMVETASLRPIAAAGVPQRNDTGRLRNVAEKKPSSRLLTRVDSSKNAGVASQRNDTIDPATTNPQQVAAGGRRRVYPRRSAEERRQSREQRSLSGRGARLRAPNGLDTSLHKNSTTSEPPALAVPRPQERRSCTNLTTTQADEFLRTSINEKPRRVSGTPAVDLSRRHRRASGLSSVRLGGQSRFDRPISTDDGVTLESVSSTPEPLSFDESVFTEEHDPGEIEQQQQQQQNHIQPIEMLPSTQDATTITNGAISDPFIAHPTPDFTESISLGASSINTGISEKEVDDELRRQNIIWGHYERKKERDELRQQNRELLALLRAREQEDQQRATTAEAEVQDPDQAVALALEMSLQDAEPKPDGDEDLALAMEISRRETEMRESADNALNLVVELSRQETQGREQNSEIGEEDNALNVVMALSRQETLEIGEEDNALNLAMELSRQETQRIEEPVAAEEDNALNLVIELSRQETQRMEEPEVGEEENHLNLILELSKRDSHVGIDKADMELMPAMDLSRQEGGQETNMAQPNDIDES